MKTVLMVVLLFVVVALVGCEESQQKQKVWGKGELPEGFSGFFGDSNNARLDFVQSQAIANCARRLMALEATAVDPNVISERFEGIDREIEALEATAFDPSAISERIEALDRAIVDLKFVGPKPE